jgi:AraC-like DNA-binding protein
MTGVSLRKHLQTILEEKLLPAARIGAPLIWLEVPISIGSEKQATATPIEVVSTPAKALPKVKAHRSHIALHYWPEHFLNSLRVPYLACVFEGEADITTGLTSEQAKQFSKERNSKGVLPFGRQTVSIREPGFFLVPPGAPVSYGSRPHWERPDPQHAYSRIFWIHLLPAGVLCHTCSSSRGRHRTNPFVFVADEHLPSLSNLLLTEVSRRSEQNAELAHALLPSLLLKVSQALSREKSVLLESGTAIESAAALRPGAVISPRLKQPVQTQSESTIVRRATQFIENNLNQKLDPPAIAAHCYISVSHLSRVFQAELSTPVMEYITQLRLNKARALLVETDLPISEVAGLSGYANPSHFSQLFSRHENCSPRAFRSRNQKRLLHDKSELAPQ